MKLQEGKSYQVEWNDCCVQGSFNSTFVKLKEETLLFENGVEISTYETEKGIEAQWGYNVTESSTQTTPDILLRKYIEHVSCCEGTDFLSAVYVDKWGSPLSPEDLKLLKHIRDT